MPPTIDFGTGEGVRIAVIDDGIYQKQPEVKNLIGGARFVVHADGIVETDCTGWAADFPHSHGTICATLISHRVPDASIYSLRVLDDRRRGHPLALVAALEWAIKTNIRLVNISLGTISQEHVGALRAQCKAAAQAGIIIVAAAHARGWTSYPSAFPEIISVGCDERYHQYEYGFYPGRRPEFLASGVGVTSFGREGSSGSIPAHSLYSNGTSIAAARMTANVAALLENMPSLDPARCKEELAAHETKLTFAEQAPISTPPKESASKPWAGVVASLPIQHAAVYLLEQETELLLSNLEQFPFHIECVVDPIHPAMPGQNAGALFGRPDVAVPVVAGLDSIPRGVDTLIVGNLEDLRRTERTDYLCQVLEWAAQNNKNAFCLGPEDLQAYRTFCDAGAKKGLRFMSAHTACDPSEWADMPEFDYEIDVPVVGVFGTSFNQGKFQTQLALRRYLGAEGYKVGMVGTNPLCALTEVGLHVTQDHRSIDCLPIREQVPCWQAAIWTVYQARPHIILIGSQGAVAPARLYRVDPLRSFEDKDLRDLPWDYSLPALTVLMASKPDVVILAINHVDPPEQIERTIVAIEALGQTRVIALVLADKAVVADYAKYTQSWGRTLPAEEFELFRAQCQSVFNLPVYCPFYPQHQKELAQVVVQSFEEKPPVAQEERTNLAGASHHVH